MEEQEPENQTITQWREKVVITLIGLVGIGILLTVCLFKLM